MNDKQAPPAPVALEPPPERMQFDLRLRDTELGWMFRVDRYALLIVPAWFNLIGWVALVGGLEFFRRKSGSVLLGVVVALSTVFIWRYLVAVIERVEFVGLAPRASTRRQFFISEAISAVITCGGFYLVHRAVDIIAKVSAA